MTDETNPVRRTDAKAGGQMATHSLFKVPGALVLGLGLLLGTGQAGCTASAEHHEALAEYPVTTPLRRDTEIVHEYVAQVRAIQHIELRALERGYLEDIFIDEGRSVQKGQRMFKIMPMIYEAEAKRAQAEADFAAIEYRNTETLTRRKVVSDTELALAKAKLDKATAEQALAEAHLSLTEVRAPFDGIMGRLEVRTGSLVDEGELLTTLADNSEMWVYFNVSEREYPGYAARIAKEGALPVLLRMADGTLFHHAGSLETIEADFNNETGNIAFRATFPNPDGLLRHGETGNILLGTPLPRAQLIPQKATFDLLDKKFVYVVDAEHIVHLREITVLYELPHLFVVGSGLSDDDQILLDGLRKVRDGHEVAVSFEEPEQVVAELDLPAE